MIPQPANMEPPTNHTIGLPPHLGEQPRLPIQAHDPHALLMVAMTHGGALSSQSIRAAIETRLIVVEPYEPGNVGPATLDLRLGGTEPITLAPKQFRRATTLERIKVPASIQAEVRNRSGVGRLGIWTENAGYVDPGWPLAELTLELFNGSDEPHTFHPGQRICQVGFTWLDLPTDRPYHLHGSYVGQSGPTASRLKSEGPIYG